MQDNDTSFMVMGEIESSEKDNYIFTSGSDQFVTVLVVPEKSLDTFSIQSSEILKTTEMEGIKASKSIASSASENLINWITFKVKKGETFKAGVSLMSSGHFLSKTYRLYVIGSTGFSNTDISGPHQISRKTDF